MNSVRKSPSCLSGALAVAIGFSLGPRSPRRSQRGRRHRRLRRRPAMPASLPPSRWPKSTTPRGHERPQRPQLLGPLDPRRARWLQQHGWPARHHGRRPPDHPSHGPGDHGPTRSTARAKVSRLARSSLASTSSGRRS